MTKEEFQRIIAHLETKLMNRVQKKIYRNMAEIPEEKEIDEAFFKITGRQPTEQEADKIYWSEEFTAIVEEIEEYFNFRDSARNAGHFEDFSHDHPFGWRGGARNDIQS
jgi:hypothetical protein